ncbi:hypothetical protein BMS3Bbin06_02043 [bacterium BMS3Bbin06]|nr:hypothetical protein BMS3Abin08_00814 [bacterium BMS3Abin08]GBE35502.1 hypothetical protein BMS3Bbin06_02043 [bacterium BMS3Bbin06]HDO34876.1 DUF507 family protein [Nitrospirota bacterium]HDY72103.1 DUF507 family protein [Nitrospirota bacterium]
MMLSDEKIRHMSHVLLDGLGKKGIVKMKVDAARIRKQIKKSIADELGLGEEIDEKVRRKLESYSKKIMEGTSEWEILYRKFFKEEEKRSGHFSE